MKRRLRAADLFCGLGGFTLGAERAGVDVKLCITKLLAPVRPELADDR